MCSLRAGAAASLLVEVEVAGAPGAEVPGLELVWALEQTSARADVAPPRAEGVAPGPAESSNLDGSGPGSLRAALAAAGRLPVGRAGGFATYRRFWREVG